MEVSVADCVADWLNDQAAPLWDLIELTDVDGNDTVIRALTAAMNSRGCTVDYRPGATCWRTQLPESWDAYLAELSQSHRKQVRRMERRIFDSGRARLHTVECAADLERALPILITLHQQRQESLGRVGCFASPQFLNFHTEVAHRLLDRDMLRMHWLELDDRPAAAEYHLGGDASVFAYQGGIDPSALEESPGQLITIATLKLAIDQGYRYFDFLRGDEAYKAHWCAKPQPTAKVRVVPNRLATRLRHNIWAAAKGIQTFVRGAVGDSLSITVGEGGR
jgi:CelD/BcsL family acetyltransferase involved in cellulose biosynthesis